MNKLGILEANTSPCEFCGTKSIRVEEGVAVCSFHSGRNKRASAEPRMSRHEAISEAAESLSQQKETDK